MQERGSGQQRKARVNSKEPTQRLRPYDVVSGVVSELRPFGAFVDIEGGAKGLLHISQISEERVTTVQQVFQVRVGRGGLRD